MSFNIYITGPDGSGKTTYIKKLEEYFKNRNYRVQHVWLRSPKLFSKPLMAFCRLVGLTRYQNINGIVYGEHRFYKSRIISWIYPPLQFLDFNLKWRFYKRRLHPRSILLFDRFALDTLADIMVDTHRDYFHRTWIGKHFIKMIPENTKIIALKLDEKIIRDRKLDTKYDPQLERKIHVYKLLSQELDLETLNNEQSRDKTFEQLINMIPHEGY